MSITYKHSGDVSCSDLFTQDIKSNNYYKVKYIYTYPYLHV